VSAQPTLPFQYFVLRCMPRVDRGEFVNVGVVIFCEAAEFLDARIELSTKRLAALDDGIDLDALTAALTTIEAVCRGEASAGEAAGGDLGKRFGWLAAPRSTALQPGPVHGGLTDDPAAELTRLAEALVR
jgi:Protein of unknown function (DUF3037)